MLNRKIIFKIKIYFAILFLFIPDAMAGMSDGASLSRALNSKPSCEVVRNKDSGIYDILINDHEGRPGDEFSERARRGDLIDASFRGLWIFTDMSFMVGEVLSRARQRGIQNPSNILKELIKKRIGSIDGIEEIVYRDYGIDKISAIWDETGIKSFILPITKEGADNFALIYNLCEGDFSMELKDGARLYVSARRASEIYQATEKSSDMIMDEESDSDAVRELRRSFSLLIKEAPYHYDFSKWVKGNNWIILKDLAEGRNIFPAYIEIHPSDKCNFNCRWCRGGFRENLIDNAAHPYLMTKERLLSFIDDVYNLNPEALIRFSGFIGEPLMNPDIIHAFKRASELYMRWGLTTTGALLTPEINEVLLNADFINVSLDAGTSETYNKLKDLPAGSKIFDKVIKNLSSLACLKNERSSSLKIGVSVLLQPENWREISELSRLLKGAGVNILQLKIAHIDEKGLMGEDVVREMYKEIKDIQRRDNSRRYNVYIMQEEKEAAEKLQGDYKGPAEHQCYAARIQAVVAPDGLVYTCCHYGYKDLGSQGDLKSENFEDIWNGVKRKNVIRRDPAGHCMYCPPADAKFNKLVSLLKKGLNTDPDFLDWVEENYVDKDRRDHKAELKNIFNYSSPGSKDKPLVIALGTSWIPGYKKEDGIQYEALNPLISSLRTYCESIGIVFIADNDDNLLRRLDGFAQDGRMIILADKDTMASDEFSSFCKKFPKTFFFGIDSHKLKADSYISLIEILSLAMEISSDMSFDENHFSIRVIRGMENIFTFILPAQLRQMDYGQLRSVYMNEAMSFA